MLKTSNEQNETQEINPRDNYEDEQCSAKSRNGSKYEILLPTQAKNSLRQKPTIGVLEDIIVQQLIRESNSKRNNHKNRSKT